MTIKLLSEHLLGFLRSTGGLTGSSESTLIKMPHCWKSHVTAQLLLALAHAPNPASTEVPQLNMMYKQIYVSESRNSSRSLPDDENTMESSR